MEASSFISQVVEGFGIVSRYSTSRISMTGCARKVLILMPCNEIQWNDYGTM